MAAGIIAALFVATAWPVIALGVMRGRMASDQLRFHEVVIRLFAADLPSPDLSDYRSATSPGYHLVLAAASKLVGDSRLALQLAGSLFTIGLLALVALVVAERRRTLETILLCLPIAATPGLADRRASNSSVERRKPAVSLAAARASTAMCPASACRRSEAAFQIPSAARTASGNVMAASMRAIWLRIGRFEMGIMPPPRPA